MTLNFNQIIKVFFIYFISYIYLNIFLKILKDPWLKDFNEYVNILNGSSNLQFNPQNIFYFKFIDFIHKFIKDESQTLLLIGSIALTIYIFVFLKHKNSIFLLLNFIILPITPVFFLSINRFALSSALAIFAIDYIHSNKSEKKNKPFIFLLIFSLIIHLSSILIIFLSFIKFNYLKILDLKSLALRSLNKKNNRIGFFSIISFFLLIIYFLLIKLNLNEYNLLYQNVYIVSCIANSCSENYSIFILPISFFILIAMEPTSTKNELDIKFNMLIFLFSITIVSVIVPVFMRYWIPFLVLISRFAKKNIIIPNINLFIYSIYLLPKYLLL